MIKYRKHRLSLSRRRDKAKIEEDVGKNNGQKCKIQDKILVNSRNINKATNGKVVQNMSLVDC